MQESRDNEFISAGVGFAKKLFDSEISLLRHDMSSMVAPKGVGDMKGKQGKTWENMGLCVAECHLP